MQMHARVCIEALEAPEILMDKAWFEWGIIKLENVESHACIVYMGKQWVLKGCVCTSMESYGNYTVIETYIHTACSASSYCTAIYNPKPSYTEGEGSNYTACMVLIVWEYHATDTQMQTSYRRFGMLILHRKLACF